MPASTAPDLAEARELITAILSGAVSLAGLLLVFTGFLLAQAATFPRSTTENSVIRRYKYAAQFGVVPFLGCFVVALAAVAWLLTPTPLLFQVAWIGFVGLAIVTATYGAFVILKYL